MRKLLVVLSGILAVLIITSIEKCFIANETSDLQIVKDESYFSDFNVEEEKVYIKCQLTIKNNGSVDKSFQLNAILRDDVELGLLKSENLKGYDEDLTNDKFTIESRTIKEFSVVFIGDFAGTNRKQDRNLPEIVITTIE